MAKSNPIGVRFDLDLLEVLKEDHKIDSPQKALNFLSIFYRDHKPDKVNFKKEFSDIRITKRESSKSKKEIRLPLPKDYVEVKNISSISNTGDATPLFNKKEIEKRIAELETEIASPPKNYSLGLKFWHKMKQKQLDDLKGKL